MKVVCPWHMEIVTEPKKIESLIEKCAVTEWYETHSQKNIEKQRPSTFNFLLNEKQRVRKFIHMLSDLEKIIVYLRFWENCILYEISNLLGLSERKVESVLEQAVRRLRGFYILELCKIQASSLSMRDGNFKT